MSGVFGKRLALIGMILVLMIVPIAALAQSTTEGAIGGTVSDVQGAVIPKASVTVRNIGTNAQQITTTDESGYFRVIRLQPAVYEVTVSATGFANYKATAVTVNIGSTTELSAKLKPAGANETVEVESAAPQVNTTSAEFAPVVSEVEIKNLPINGGRWSNFVLLTPGVVMDSTGFGLVSFRGMSTLQNNNTIDGADNNQAFFAEERGRTRVGYSSPKAAIQEFQVNTSNYSVEYGRAVGGVVNTVTKSGTNNLHGEMYFYDRDNNWGATNPYTTLTTQSAPGVFTTSPFKPKDWRKMTGTGIGGPIIKDKLFFFFAFDFYKRNFPGLGIASNSSRFFATPSASTINSLATNLGITAAQATTLYNQDLGDLITTLGPNNREGAQYLYLPKIDWQINQKNHFSIVVNRMNWDSPAGIQTQSSNTYGRQSFGNDFVRIMWGVAKLNTTISNNIVNEFRTQYGRDFEFQNPQVPTPYEDANLSNSAKFPGYTNPFGHPPQVFITNGWTLGTVNFLTRTKYPDERRQQYADTVTWAKGKHLFKFGGDFTHVSDDTANLFTGFGAYSYSSLLNYFTDLNSTITPGTVNPAHSCKATVGGVANTVVPCYTSFTQAFGPQGFKFSTNDYGFFFQDDWKVTPRLSLSLGVRWDYQQMPEPFTALVNPDVKQTAAMPSDKNNIGPRVGFAYDVFGDGKTSLRGGASIVYGRTINSTLYSALTSTGVSAGQTTYNITPSSQCATQFPKVYSDASFASNPLCSANKSSLVYFANKFQNPKVYHVNLSLDRQLSSNTVLQLSYLGSFGRNLPLFVDTNIDPTSKIENTFVVCGVNGAGATDLTSCYTPQPGQFLQGSTYTAPFYKTRLSAAQCPTCTKYGAMDEVRSFGTSSYHAMAVQVNRRMSRNIQFNTNYTWSHAIDYGQNNQTFTPNSGSSVLDPYNLDAEKGNSNSNVPHRFVASAVLQSPWKQSGWLSFFTNDWQVAPLWQWQKGLPYSVKTSGTPSGGYSGNGGINGSNGDFRLYGGRNLYTQPATQNWDMKLSKLIKFHERYSAEFSGEVFNMFNHQNVTSVGTTAYFIGKAAATTVTSSGQTILKDTPTITYNTGAYGVPSNANSNFAYSPRQVQLGVKFKF
jgi:outer membrane receptor protein involved in Fe transport